MKLRALIFDVDGTLADTEEAHRIAFNEAFRDLDLGWNWSRQEYAQLLLTTGGKERLAAYVDSRPLPAEERRRLGGRIEAIHRAKTQNYTRMVHAGEVPLRDGVAPLIEEAGQCDVLLGIASTTTFANIEALLRTTLGSDWLRRFAAIGAGDQVARKKPARDIYDYVLGKLAAAADQCVAVEDSANGLHAAKAAGLYTIVTPSYWTRAEDFSDADWLLPSLGSQQETSTPQSAAQQVGLREIEQRLCAMRDFRRQAMGDP